METVQPIDSSFDSPSQITLTNDDFEYLNSIRKWTRFLAILGFIFVGLMVIGGFSIGSIFSALGPNAGTMPIPSSIFGVLYLFFAAIYFFPILYLYRFSSNLGLALNGENNITQAFAYLKSHYKFIGILAIIIMGLYGMVLLGVLVGLAFR